MRTVGLALLAACSGVDVEPPAPLEPPVPFSACAVPVGGFPAPELVWKGVSATLSGPILDAGEGVPPEGYFDEASFLSTPEVDRDRASWFRAVDEAGAEWIAGMVLPESVLGLAIGDPVDATFTYLPGQFGPTIGGLSVHDGVGALRGWVGVGGDLPDLLPPDGLALAAGARVGGESSDCGDWSYYEIEATLDATQATLPYGGEAALGPIRLWHGGFDETDEYAGCPDWFVAHVAVAAAP